MELIKTGEKTYYIKHKTNIGVYTPAPGKACLIDTGYEGDGEEIDEIMAGQGWEIEYIINTHTHIDHLGGNRYLMEKYGIPAYCADYDIAFAEYTDLEAAYMAGGYPCRELRDIFVHPGKIGFKPIEDSELEGIEWTYLPGHTFGMIGVKTDDDVWFLADSYLNRTYIKRHRFGYLYDVGGYLDTLERIKKFDGKMFIPAHGVAEEDISETVDLNRENMLGIIDEIKDICEEWISLDEILKAMYERMKMRNSVSQHAMLSSTTKGYLTYLQDRDEMACDFQDNIMVWKTMK